MTLSSKLESKFGPLFCIIQYDVKIANEKVKTSLSSLALEKEKKGYAPSSNMNREMVEAAANVPLLLRTGHRLGFVSLQASEAVSFFCILRYKNRRNVSYRIFHDSYVYCDNFILTNIINQRSHGTMAASSTFLAVFTLIALCAFGVYSMHSLIDRNGYLAAVKDIRDNGPRLLPGSDTPLLEEYTGFHPVDYHMSLMQIFFANVTDGSSPALSMFSFYFAGQIVPVLVVLLAESYRVNQSFLFRL